MLPASVHLDMNCMAGYFPMTSLPQALTNDPSEGALHRAIC